MYSWRPVTSFKSTMMGFIGFGLIFSFIGGILFLMSGNIKEIIHQYNKCEKDSEGVCKVTFTISEKIHGPVYLYYELDNFY